MKYKCLVSIRLMTYNHSEFIIDALDGINKQKTNFIFEVVIGDDFSTDNNLEIINQYYFTNKNLRINILERKIGDDYWIKRQKYGRLYNFTNIIENCSGKYIALLDGDDYWTDPLKLQKQVDFLEANPTYGLVHTDLDILYQKLDKVVQSHYKNIGLTIPTGNIYNELLVKNTISTLTVMFKNSIIKDFLKNEKELFSFGMGDYPLWLEISHQYKIGFINESTVMYRKLEVSASHDPDVDKLYKMKSNTFKVRSYFIKKYGFNEKTKKQIDKDFYNFNLKYGFDTRNKDIAKENYLKLLEINGINLDAKLKYYGSMSNLNWNMVKLYYKIKAKKEGLVNGVFS
ncbi:MAG: glycosyltransferase [Flavobacteriaceae bacterium]|nr:glycosyltransferase [Flavobacteriaceae bacterium]